MRKLFLVLVALLALGLAGCGESDSEKLKREIKEGAAKWDVYQNNELPVDWKELVTQAILDRLRDPNSAQIKFQTEKPLLSKRTGEWLLGVEVNAKNSFGGYVGFKSCVVSIKKGEITVHMPPGY